MFTTWLGLAIVVGAPGVKDGKESTRSRVPDTTYFFAAWIFRANGSI
jgi:hypothetical protein